MNSSEPEPGPEDEPGREPPVAPGHVPGLGHLPRLMREPLAFLGSLAQQAEVVIFFLGRKPVYYVTSPGLVRSMLVADSDAFRRGRVFEKGTKIFGNGVIVAEGEAHRRQRRLLQPAFRQRQIAHYSAVMREVIERRTEAWQPGQALDIPRVAREIAVDALTHALFRTELADRAAQRIITAFPGLAAGIIAQTLFPLEWMESLPLPVNRRYQRSCAEVRGTVDGIIAQSRDSAPAGTSLLDVLAGTRELSAEQLRDEIVTLLVAGSETTAVTLAWVFHELALHPAAERQLADELAAVLGDAPVRQEDFARLPVTDRVLKEALRLHAPTWLLTRRAGQPVRLGKYGIPAGSEVAFSLTALHRDPAVFDNPREFRPERWAGEDSAVDPRLALIPFGMGRHKCIGDAFAWAELTVAVATIGRKWRLMHKPGTRVREIPLATVQPSGLSMIPERRQSRPGAG